MASRVIRCETDIEEAIKWLRSTRLPCTMTLDRKRSTSQNRLQRKWMHEAAEQLGDDSPEGYRAFCKLHFGVPILRNENDAFRESYDRILKPHSYEDKLIMMAEPLDFPVTRLMTSAQKTRYLNDVYVHLTSLGVQLTEPPDHHKGIAV